MRRLVTLDPDTAALLERCMRQRGISFEQAINDAIRDGLGAAEAQQFRTRTASMGMPGAPLDRALQIAGDLEDGEL